MRILMKAEVKNRGGFMETIFSFVLLVQTARRRRFQWQQRLIYETARERNIKWKPTVWRKPQQPLLPSLPPPFLPPALRLFPTTESLFPASFSSSSLPSHAITRSRHGGQKFTTPSKGSQRWWLSTVMLTTTGHNGEGFGMTVGNDFVWIIYH